MMKKGFLFLLSLVLSHSALAESDVDLALKAIGVIDEDYKYTDDDLAAAFFRLTTTQYAQSLPSDINSFTRIQSAMFTPYFADVQAMYTIHFTEDERREVINNFSSKQLLQELCIDYFIPNDFMLANNYTLIYSFHDQDYRRLADVQINSRTCLDALTN
ncbi:hypothetical protein [Psychrobacter sp. YP14]|uniref:hypothetical protein n=1 Tax=Psychrobacter sp. YP14 TaxID=2203895 RepID=UPI001D0D9F4D|nr:hypothetical protein [Psychrobacter sp. YP14]